MTPDGHLDDELSALLDDELAQDEVAGVHAHLATCGPCRTDLDAERNVRELVRGLPAVAPPLGLYERLGLRPVGRARRYRRLGFGAAGLAATAAAWLLVLGVTNVHSAEGSVQPAVAQYVSAHASVQPTSYGAGNGVTEASVARAYNVPDHLAGTYQLVGEQDDDGTPQLVYRDGAQTLSMFLQPGHLNVAALPNNAEPVSVNGAPAWRVPADDGDVIYVQRPGVVVVIVGHAPSAAATDVASAPTPSTGGPSLPDRVRAAGRGLLETFGLQG